MTRSQNCNDINELNAYVTFKLTRRDETRPWRSLCVTEQKFYYCETKYPIIIRNTYIHKYNAGVFHSLDRIGVVWYIQLNSHLQMYLLACWFADIFEKKTCTTIQTKCISNHWTCWTWVSPICWPIRMPCNHKTIG